MQNEVSALLRLQVKEEVTTQMLKARQELEKFQKQSNHAKDAVKALFQEFAVPLTVGGAVATVVALTRESLRLATALEETERSARLVFGDALPRMRAEADQLAQSMRRSESDILHYMAGFGSFFKQLGAGPAATQQMSQALAQLTVEFGKLKPSIPDEEIFRALQQGVAGNYRSLKELGVLIKDDTLQLYANSLAIRNKVKDMDAEQEATLVTMYLLDQSKKKQAELADATGSVGDTAKSAGAAWQDLQEEMGKNVAPIAAATFGMLADALGRVRAALTDSKVALMELARYAAGTIGIGGGVFDTNVSLAKHFLGMQSADATPFGPEKPAWMNVDMKEVNGILNRKPQKASGGGGGGGGGDSEETKALAEAKRILSDIVRIEKELADAHGKQAEANKKRQEGLREDLKLKKEIGALTKQEARELETLNRRLGDGRERIDDLKDGFDDAKRSVEEFKKKVEEINQELLDIGKNLKRSFEDVDRDATRRRGETIAGLIEEQADLEGQLARGEGLSAEEQRRLGELDDMLRHARGQTPGQFADAEKLSKLDELERIDYEAEEKKKDLAREANEKQADAVSRLTQANYDLAAAEGQVKALKGDLVLAIQDYELKLKATYLSVEETTERHVNFQVAKLKEETDAAYALAKAYSEVGAFFAAEGGGSISLPSGRANTPAAGAPAAAAPNITISGNVVINNESDYQALLRRLTRDIQLQTQGSSSSR